MGGNYLGDAGQLLVNVLFGIYMVVVMLRFLMQLHRVDFYNPISQMVVTVTNPPVMIFRKIIPGLWGMDLACLFVLFLLALLKFYLLLFLHGALPPLLPAMWIALVSVIDLAIDVYFYMIFIRVILSWIAPMSRHPAALALYQLTEPLMGKARRLLPSFGGLDFSPILILLGLQLIRILLLSPMMDFGRVLMAG